jgi:hypothetical protein
MEPEDSQEPANDPDPVLSQMNPTHILTLFYKCYAPVDNNKAQFRL